MGTRTPAFLLACVLAVCVAFTAAAVLLASQQPWLGLDLAVQGDAVIIRSVKADGPSADLPKGATVLSVAGLQPKTTDLIEEPDVFTTYAELNEFRARQAILHAAQTSGRVTFQLKTPATERQPATVQTFTLRPAPHRPLSSLPVVFWFQIAVGVIACAIAGWAWSLKPADRGAQMFGLSGLAMVVCTCAASVYSTRELGLDRTLFRVLTSLNIIGAGGFGIAMVQLFLVYPKPLVKGWSLWVAPVVFGAWLAGYIANIMWAANTSYHLVTLEMLAIIGGIAWQVRATRHSATDRAALTWLGLSVIIGAGAFVFASALPVLLGSAPVVEQGYIFVVFLIIYVGLALGLRRYRLFDIGEWAFRVLFYVGAAVAFLVMDVVLIGAIKLAPVNAVGLSILAVAFMYLPMRDTLWRRTVARKRVAQHELFEMVMDTAFAISGAQRAERWIALVNNLFDPLETTVADTAPEHPAASSDGLELILPATADAPALMVRYPWKGRGLFAPFHLKLARQLTRLMRNADASRAAFEMGAAGERRRIARDLHDDVGARLLSGLHKPDVDQTRDVLREAMADMRTIVAGLTGAHLPLSRVLAQLRYETSRRLETAGVELNWPVTASEEDETPLPYTLYKSLGSGHREAISNVIKHAEASRVAVTVEVANGAVVMTISDNGRGMAASAEPDRPGGLGLSNLSRRFEELGGRIDFPQAPTGVVIRFALPLSIDEARLPNVASAHG